MEPDTLRQVRGGVELVADAVETAVGAAAELHHTILRQVYAPFDLLGPIGAPARVIEQAQTAVTRGVYGTILGTSRIVARGVLALLAGQAEPR